MQSRCRCIQALLLAVCLVVSMGMQTQRTAKSATRFGLNSNQASSGTQLARARQDGDGTLYVYVQIDKAGSTTIRNIAGARASYYGWPPVCMANKAEDFTVCDSQPDGALVMGRWGWCAAQQRSCKYVVMLREPVDRILSAYSYFCLGCQDGNKYCGYDFRPFSCPHVSFVEFARKYNNLYTRKFARSLSELPPSSKDPNPLTMGGDYRSGVGLTDKGFMRNLTDKDWHLALQHLQSSAVVTLALEDPHRMERLAAHMKESKSFQSLNASARCNEFKSSYAPSRAELDEVTQLLDYDIRLYRALFGA